MPGNQTHGSNSKPPDRGAARDGQEGEFKRELGFFSLLAMSLGTVIGSGWLLLPGLVASKAGPAALLSWVLAGMAMLVIALVYAEMGAAWPAPGAVAEYPYLSHGRFTGHLAGWAAFISYLIIPPAEAVAVTRYAGTAAPVLLTADHTHLSVWGLLVAAVILGLLTLLNWVGVRYLAIFENYITVAKYVPILVFVLGVGFLAFHPANFTHFGGWLPHGPSGVLLGLSSTLFAYLGFRQALAFSGEAANPGRDLPRAIIWTMIIAILTYGVIDIIFTGAINWTQLEPYGAVAGSWASLSNLTAPLYDVTAAAGVGFVAWLIFFDGIISPNGPNATNVGSVPRVAYTMAEDGTMPHIFTLLNPRYGTPGWGLFICFLIEIFFLYLTSGGYGSLISAINVAFMVAYGIGPVAMGTLRQTAPHVKRPFWLPFGRFLAPLAFFFASLLLYWSSWPLTGEMLAVLFVGVVIYAYYVVKGQAGLETVKNGVWLIVYLAAMEVISYAGDTRFGGQGLFHMPWDIVTIFVVSMIVYAWGTRRGVAYDSDREPEGALVEYREEMEPEASD